MKLILFVSLILSLMAGHHPVSMHSVSNDSECIVGVWLNAEKEDHIYTSKENGHYVGKLVWLKEPNAANGQPKVDDKNPEVAKRSRPILGLTLIDNLVYTGDNEWNGGSIYDAHSGRTYRCKLSLRDAQTLDIRGYMGISLLGRTTPAKKVVLLHCRSRVANGQYQDGLAARSRFLALISDKDGPEALGIVVTLGTTTEFYEFSSINFKVGSNNDGICSSNNIL